MVLDVTSLFRLGVSRSGIGSDDTTGDAMKVFRALVIGALATAAATFSFADIAQAQQKNTLRVVMHTGLRAIDPFITSAYIARDYGYLVYDTLFSTDEALKVQPQMVEKYEASADKLVWTFTLRSGLKFHDGAPVTTADVISSLTRWGKVDSMGQTLFTFVKELKAVDQNTFQIVLSEPYGLVLESLGKQSSNVPFIMPKRVADTPATQAITETIGSGPFRLLNDEWRPGVKAAFEKFADYKPRSEPPSGLAGGKVAKVDRVEWVVIGDPQTTMNALLRNEIDVWEMPPHDLLPALKADRNLVVKDRNPLAHVSLLRFNSAQPPFNNPKLREVVLNAIYQDDYLLAQVGDKEYYKTCAAIFGCSAPYESDKGAVHLKKPDINKAKQMLKDAGYKGEKVVILQPTDVAIVAPLGPVTAQALRNIGMNVDLQTMDWLTMLQRRTNTGPVEQGGWSIFHTAQAVADLMNPVSNNYIRGKGVTDGGFFGWPEDAEMERLRAAFARETDPAKQKALAQAAHDRAYERLPYIPLGLYIQPPAYRKNVSGWVQAPAMVFWNVEKK